MRGPSPAVVILPKVRFVFNEEGCEEGGRCGTLVCASQSQSLASSGGPASLILDLPYPVALP